PDEPAVVSKPLDASVFTVRLLLGVGDNQVQTWNGRMKLDQGEVLSVEGWRFRQGDRVSGQDGWEAKSHVIRKAAAKKAAAKQQAQRPTGPSTFGPTITPNGVVIALKAPLEASLAVETDHGRFSIPLADLAEGTPRRYLDGQVEAQRVPPNAPLREGKSQDDFPAAASGAGADVWVAFVNHQPRGPEVLESFRERPKSFAEFVPKGGGDQVKLMRVAGGKPGETIDVTEAGLDLWRPSVAVAGDGSVVVAWSECVEGNWDIYSRTFDPTQKSWSERKRLTTNALTDTDVVLATAADGKVWMAWQSWTDGQADIWLAQVDDASSLTRITQTEANEWSPAIASDKSGNIHVAFDTYQAGNYDVILRTRTASGSLAQPITVAGTDRFEARPSIAADARGRVWITYEERTAQWGKDAENMLDGKGSSLYRTAATRVRCLDGNRLLDAPDPAAQAPEALRTLNSYPRLAVDRTGRVWLAFRHRQEAIWGNNAVMVVGAVWLEYVTSLDGRAWSVPQVLPRSDGLLDSRPALVVPIDGPALIFYSTDGRLRREVEFTPELMRRYWAHSGTPGTPDEVFNLDLEVAALSPSAAATAVEPALAGEPAAQPINTRPPAHLNEAADVSRMRSHRIQADGKTYQLLRGEFHRHTEISQDGGSDGSLEDMWRYAIDAGRLDWIGNGDHDSGGGKEYTWWLVQKTTDMYHIAPVFVPMFCYERSVAYPHGHRNVMWDKRGVRTLPRLVDEKGVSDNDTKMFYDYLLEHGGICASHTSGTGMGTDWRDNNPRVEPIVEIFQGHRNSYEHLGAPRVARRESEAIGGWRPLGMVWNALAMQYRLGYQASSDHISTHISYAIAIAENRTRSAILDAFRKRHCYGATDNILLDVRSGEHLMGEEFNATGPVHLKVLAHGTGLIARVDIIKDFIYVFSTEPHSDRVELEWTDDEHRPPGLSWYYIRVLQENGEIAWGSPIWVHLAGSSGN
ncbi:MAG TPA: hypothetical protein VGY53_00745, partial [Isosphaeraceae bacterium]|nr:hypothetical protein [Isosphaeraceae bacterium]